MTIIIYLVAYTEWKRLEQKTFWWEEGSICKAMLKIYLLRKKKIRTTNKSASKKEATTTTKTALISRRLVNGWTFEEVWTGLCSEETSGSDCALNKRSLCYLKHWKRFELSYTFYFWKERLVRGMLKSDKGTAYRMQIVDPKCIVPGVYYSNLRRFCGTCDSGLVKLTD